MISYARRHSSDDNETGPQSHASRFIKELDPRTVVFHHQPSAKSQTEKENISPTDEEVIAKQKLSVFQRASTLLTSNKDGEIFGAVRSSLLSSTTDPPSQILGMNQDVTPPSSPELFSSPPQSPAGIEENTCKIPRSQQERHIDHAKTQTQVWGMIQPNIFSDDSDDDLISPTKMVRTSKCIAAFTSKDPFVIPSRLPEARRKKFLIADDMEDSDDDTSEQRGNITPNTHQDRIHAFRDHEMPVEHQITLSQMLPVTRAKSDRTTPQQSSVQKKKKKSLELPKTYVREEKLFLGELENLQHQRSLLKNWMSNTEPAQTLSTKSQKRSLTKSSIHGNRNSMKSRRNEKNKRTIMLRVISSKSRSEKELEHASEKIVEVGSSSVPKRRISKEFPDFTDGGDHFVDRICEILQTSVTELNLRFSDRQKCTVCGSMLDKRTNVDDDGQLKCHQCSKALEPLLNVMFDFESQAYKATCRSLSEPQLEKMMIDTYTDGSVNSLTDGKSLLTANADLFWNCLYHYPSLERAQKQLECLISKKRELADQEKRTRSRKTNRKRLRNSSSAGNTKSQKINQRSLTEFFRKPKSKG